MITRKSSTLCVSLEKQNISEMFPPSSVLFQSYLFVRAYWGLKDKPVNIVSIVSIVALSVYINRVLSTGDVGKLPPKSFPKKKLKAISNKDLF